MAEKILVADDSSAVRQSIKFVLTNNGYEVVEAENGEEAAKTLSDNEYSLVITDINMPKKDGIGLIKDVRQSSGNKFTPIIVLTTESQNSKMEEGKKAGATAWIVKPFQTEKLLEVVKKVIE